jgi:DNA-binding MarR family transcriptional regulator
MLLKHNSAVELVDRTIEQGLLRRSDDEADHRRILLRVTPQGERILAALAEFHTRELEQSGPELVSSLDGILRSTRRGATRGDRMKRQRKAAAR